MRILWYWILASSCVEWRKKWCAVVAVFVGQQLIHILWLVLHAYLTLVGYCYVCYEIAESNRCLRYHCPSNLKLCVVLLYFSDCM